MQKRNSVHPLFTTFFIGILLSFFTVLFHFKFVQRGYAQTRCLGNCVSWNICNHNGLSCKTSTDCAARGAGCNGPVHTINNPPPANPPPVGNPGPGNAGPPPVGNGGGAAGLPGSGVRTIYSACGNGGVGVCSTYNCPGGKIALYGTQSGAPGNSCGVNGPGAGVPRGQNVICCVSPDNTGVDECVNASCGNGYYCGGQCGVTGSSSNRYYCVNRKQVGVNINCGCRSCINGPDVCTSGASGVSSCFNTCANHGGTCIPKSYVSTHNNLCPNGNGPLSQFTCDYQSVYPPGQGICCSQVSNNPPPPPSQIPLPPAPRCANNKGRCTTTQDPQCNANEYTPFNNPTAECQISVCKGPNCGASSCCVPIPAKAPVWACDDPTKGNGFHDIKNHNNHKSCAVTEYCDPSIAGGPNYPCAATACTDSSGHTGRCSTACGSNESSFGNGLYPYQNCGGVAANSFAKCCVSKSILSSLSVGLFAGNSHPVTTQVTATTTVANTQLGTSFLASNVLGAQVYTAHDILLFDPLSILYINPLFKLGQIPLGTYEVIIHVDRHLDRKLIQQGGSSVFTIASPSDAILFATTTLTPGDIAPPHGDNFIDLLDYNLMISCIKKIQSSCPDPTVADINADGVVDQKDLDILLSHFGALGDSFSPPHFTCVTDPSCTSLRTKTMQLCSLKCTINK